MQRAASRLVASRSATRIVLWTTALVVTAATAPARAAPVVAIRGDDAVLVPPVVDRTRDAHGPDTLYLNRCTDGCNVLAVPGLNDARNHISSIPAQDSTLTAFRFDDATWNAMVTCVRDVYLPYGVTVVTDHPDAQTPYVEVMVAGTPAQLGLPATTLGIAPMSNDCSAGVNWIAFAFANVHSVADGGIELCATVAHEAGHVYGLEHVFECEDPMTYLTGCGQKFFRNQLMRCGTSEAVDCRCTGPVQNTHVKLLSALGEGADPPPPTLSIGSPMNGATVARGFSVFATATDVRDVTRLELRVNGWLWNEVPGVPGKTSPYVIDLPSEVPDGRMDLEVRACNDLEVCTTREVSVTRGTPCAGDDACLAGQTCDGEGRCAWAPATGQLGDACTYDQACLSGLCADVGGGVLGCTTTCFGGPNDACPDGFTCAGGAGQAGVCGVPVVDDGGCCSTGSGSSGVASVALLVGVVAIGLRRRRRPWARHVQLVVAVLVLGAGACGESRGSADRSDTSSVEERFVSRGLVVSVAPKVLAIHHEAMGAVRTFDGKLAPMHSMTMEFAAPKTGLDGIAVDDKVRFEFTVHYDSDPTLRLTRVERLPPDTALALE